MPSEKTACTFCGSADSVPLYRTRDVFTEMWTIVKCRHCSAYFLTPKPTAEQLSKAYNEDYYGEGDEKFEGFIERQIDGFRRARARRLARQAGKSGRVLDIGCGNGRFLQYIAQNGTFEIFGIEMEGGSADRAERIPGLHLKHGQLEAGDFKPSFFDAVTMLHVFEHLTQPRKTLDIIDHILKPGGTLMMSFPNIESWQSRCFKGNWLHLDPPRHLFFFGPGDFKKLMDKRGYTIVSQRYFSPEYNPFGFQQSALNMLCRKREILYEHLKGNKDYCRDYSAFNIFIQKAFTACTLPLFLLTDLLASVMQKSATVEFVFEKRIV